MKRLRTSILSFSLLLLAATSLLAQGVSGSSGTLAGEAQDQNGKPLPGVLITAAGTSGSKTATTGSNGKFIIPYLTPGVYTVKSHLEGFADIEQADVEVRLGHRTEMTFKMKQGQQEVLVITGETPTVDVTSTTTGANLSDKLLKSIPVGRSFASTVALAPGVTDAGVGDNNLSISGASGLENTYIVDGVNITDTGFGAVGTYSYAYGSLGSGFNADMVKEIQVKSGGFEPEYGQALGGVVNVITKTGGNSYAGEGYFYFSPAALQGDFSQRQFVDSFISNTKEIQSVDGGVDIGGPIVRDRVFFFGAYNPRRVRRTFLNDPTAASFAQIQSSTRDRVSQAYSGKVSANPWSRHTFDVSVFGDPSHSPTSFQNPDNMTFDNPDITQSRLEYGTNSQKATWTGILRPHMFAEGQFARSHTSFQEILTPAGDQFEFFDFSGAVVTTSGGLGFYEKQTLGTNKQYNLKLTNLWGNHELKYGVQYENVDYSGGFNYTGPTFTAFNGTQTTTGAIVIILNGGDIGHPEFSKVYGVVRDLITPIPVPTTTQYLNWFAQDAWNITSSLNVQYGVRWERQEMKGDVPNSNDIVFSNNWAPRVGVTYDYLKNGRSKAFFHYGRFFEKVPNDLAVRSLASQISTSGFYSDPALANPIPGTGVQVGGPEDVEGLTNNSPFKTKAQYSNEYVAGIEQEIQRGFSLGARYIHRDVQRVIEDIQVDLDQPCVPYLGGQCVAPGMIVENYLNDSSTYFLTTADGHYPGYAGAALVRNYTAVEITMEKRLSENWQMLGSWRISRLKGNYEGLFRRDNLQPDPNITSLEDFAPSPWLAFTFAQGPLPNDVAHLVKLFGSYRWNNGLTTGLGFNFNSGTPITQLGVIPIYGDHERVLQPRGSLGRTDKRYDMDVHADYALHLGNSGQNVTLGLDVFNLFNNQKVLTFVENSEKDTITYTPRPNPDFLKPLIYEDPRTVRFLVKYAF